jgi:hypothetical protein
MVKVSWLNFTTLASYAQIFDTDGKRLTKDPDTCDHWFPFFFADSYEDSFYNNNPWPIILLGLIPKISFNLSWNKDHENEDVEDELD